MNIFTSDHDISVMYVTAASFPEGVLAAHRQLHSLIPFTTDRRYFGLSRPEKGTDIVYRAAAEELESGEAAKLHLETIVLKKGRYVSLDISDYMTDVTAIGRAFNELLSQPGLDPQGYCVEWYVSNKDVKCMIRLKD